MKRFILLACVCTLLIACDSPGRPTVRCGDFDVVITKTDDANVIYVNINGDVARLTKSDDIFTGFMNYVDIAMRRHDYQWTLYIDGSPIGCR